MKMMNWQAEEKREHSTHYALKRKRKKMQRSNRSVTSCEQGDRSTDSEQSSRASKQSRTWVLLGRLCSEHRKKRSPEDEVRQSSGLPNQLALAFAATAPVASRHSKFLDRFPALGLAAGHAAVEFAARRIAAALLVAAIALVRAWHLFV